MNPDEINEVLDYSDDDIFGSDDGFSVFDDTDDDPNFQIGLDDSTHSIDNSGSDFESNFNLLDSNEETPQPPAYSTPTIQTPVFQVSNIRVTSMVQDYGNNIIWSDIMQSNNLVYNPTGQVVGINPDLIECLTNGRPYDFYSLFVDDAIIDMLVLETNRYASQLISTPLKSKSRLTRWENVTKKEMLTFLGICMWMG